jgi:hypothetical protein
MLMVSEDAEMSPTVYPTVTLSQRQWARVIDALDRRDTIADSQIRASITSQITVGAQGTVTGGTE